MHRASSMRQGTRLVTGQQGGKLLLVGPGRQPEGDLAAAQLPGACAAGQRHRGQGHLVNGPVLAAPAPAGSSMEKSTDIRSPHSAHGQNRSARTRSPKVACRRLQQQVLRGRRPAARGPRPAGTGLTSPSRRTHRLSTCVTRDAVSCRPSLSELLLVAAGQHGQHEHRAAACPPGSHQPPGSRTVVWSIAGPSGLLELGHRGVPDPALVLQLDGGDHHGVARCVELRAAPGTPTPSSGTRCRPAPSGPAGCRPRW